MSTLHGFPFCWPPFAVLLWGVLMGILGALLGGHEIYRRHKRGGIE